ncbi:MAG: IS1182 family transposase [Betaproteobacteria bacterium]|nr:IS1182 family transposase [Betaproteobacteria bacterium]
MPNFRSVDRNLKFIAVDFDAQILPGTFEHAVSVLVDQELDLTPFIETYRNDATGAPAYHPSVLLKVILFGYSRGLISSRAIAAACRQHVQFIALSADSQPDFSTLAGFVSRHGEAIQSLFTQVLVICNREGLIGHEMFAIDGVKLPSNAAKSRSGLREDFEREAQKVEQSVEKMLAEHRRQDAAKIPPGQEQRAREAQKIERMREHARQIRAWLEKHPRDRLGASGKPVLSNRTDNESAKMSTDKGVVQGYCGVAAVDEKHQIIVAAQAHGTGSEQALLPGMVEDLKPVLTEESVIVADAGYHSEANLAHLESEKVEAYIADRGYRDRDERYAGQERHKAKDDALWDKSPKDQRPKQFPPSAFKFADDLSTCICPAGKRLYRSGNNCNRSGLRSIGFKGTQTACSNCKLRAQCLRKPDKTPVRQVALFLGKHESAPERPIERMRRKIDTEQGRRMITRRFATVEPVFANLRHNKGLDRFTLRSRKKVEGQWQLYCLVHNIEKLMRARQAR